MYAELLHYQNYYNCFTIGFCKSGHYLTSNGCEPCPENSWNPAGDTDLDGSKFPLMIEM